MTRLVEKLKAFFRRTSHRNETDDTVAAALRDHEERVRNERWRSNGFGPRGSWSDFERGNSSEFGRRQP